MSAQNDFSDWRVLIVDDHELSRKLLMRQLENLNVTQLDAARNGEEALKKLGDDSKEYDIIFLDWAMPIMNGFDLLKKLREDKRFNHTALVMLSAEAQPDKILEAIETGITSYLTKPVKQEDLNVALGKIQEWLAKHR